MATKKPDLREALLNDKQEPEAQIVSLPKRKIDRKQDPHYRPSRVGKSNVTGYFHKAVKRQIRTLAADRDTTIQDLLEEALNDLFIKHGLPDIAKLEDRN